MSILKQVEKISAPNLYAIFKLCFVPEGLGPLLFDNYLFITNSEHADSSWLHVVSCTLCPDSNLRLVWGFIAFYSFCSRRSLWYLSSLFDAVSKILSYLTAVMIFVLRRGASLVLNFTGIRSSAAILPAIIRTNPKPSKTRSFFKMIYED